MRNAVLLGLLALVVAACGEVSSPTADALVAPTTTSTSYVSQLTTSLPPEAVIPPPERPRPVPIHEDEVLVTEQAFTAAVVGVLHAPEGAPCPVLSLAGNEFVVYPFERSVLAATGMSEFDGQQVVVRGGPPTDLTDVELECSGPIWVASSLQLLGSVDWERPRLHPEPRWDPHYTPLLVEFETVRVTYDRWFWAILDDAGFITVEIDDEVAVHGPSEWIHAPDPNAAVTRFFDPWAGRVVVTMPNALFDAAYTEAALASGAWDSGPTGEDE